MKRYPVYKDSCVEWLGDIPDHWELKKLKYILIIRNGENITSENFKNNGKYEVYGGNGFLGFTEKYNTHEDTIIIGRVGAKCGNVHLVFGNKWISDNALIVKTHQNYDFLFYLLKAMNLNNLANQNAQPLITSSMIKSQVIAIPDIDEQTKVFKYIKSKLRKLDALIEKKQNQIELLKEFRTAIINQAVTKGLNPDVKMKDSGIEWIGEIPEHWGVKKLKFIGDTIIGLSYKPENVVENDSEGILVLRASNIQNGKPSFDDNVFVNSKVDEKLITKEGDILICSRSGSRKLIGKNLTIDKSLEGNTFGVFMTIFRSKYWKYISKVLNSPIFQNLSGMFVTSTINQLTIDTLKNFIIPFPPKKIDRIKISDFLDEQTQKIDSTIEKETERIELIKEYRNSLISEAVTGKIDVRNAV